MTRAVTKGFLAEFNAGIRRTWEQWHGCDPDAVRELEVIGRKIANLRKSLEDGIYNIAYVNIRLGELQSREEELGSR